MRTIITILLLMAGIQSTAQTKAYDTLRDKENGELVYKGTITLDEVKAEPAIDWMRTGISSYIPDAQPMQVIKDNLGRYKLVVFMGTWCEDSQNLIPKLYKILKDASYPVENVTLYGVDRAKTTGTEIEQKYKVLFVPSIILLEGDPDSYREKGRITESVDKSIEADLAKIIQAK